LLKTISEQLGLRRYAVSTLPDEIVLDPPPKKFLDPPMYLGQGETQNA